MRSLIQYDLDEPPTAPPPPIGPPAPPYGHTRRPPTKKRKRNYHNPKKSQFDPSREVPLQHWDDPGSATVGMVYDEQEGSTTTPASLAAGSVAVSYADDLEEEEGECSDEPVVEGDEAVDMDAEREKEEEESRALTHEEIWDDAALIDAWNSAEAEYEAYHGASKVWKTETVKKSPLWYNTPHAPPQSGPSKHKQRSKNTFPQPPSQGPGDSEPEPDTAPVDFDTFVPTHDPSLAVPSDTTAPFFAPPPSTTMVSRDEAFNNALSAMYWGGYWTAVYHCQSQSSGQSTSTVTAGTSEENGIEADEDEEDLVPTQR
ncbi:hypothetical protein J3R82DRAFT_1261 [Butyriboletus roseoflavus]|nr:hypothetical protein J3R82DRAFT_1261 [Butyriboletus roseoflavus]